MHLTREPIRLSEFVREGDSPPGPGLARGPQRQYSPGVQAPGEWPSGARSLDSSLEAGARVLFLGVVRQHSDGREVLYLDYEAYEEMAERRIKKLLAEACARWRLAGASLLHRLGRVGLGEISVAIEVLSVHRDQAYQASRFLIEEVKHSVPIWKKEYFADGTSSWSRCGREEDSRPAGFRCFAPRKDGKGLASLRANEVSEAIP